MSNAEQKQHLLNEFAVFWEDSLPVNP